MGDQLLTYADVAARMQVSERTVKRFVSRKKLRVVDGGHRTKRFRPVDVERFLSAAAGDDAENGGAL